MERTNSMNIKLFDYSAYIALISKLGMAKEADSGNNQEEVNQDLDFVNKAMYSFYNYVNTVDVGETSIKVAKFREEGEIFRQVAMEVDKARSIAHDAAITNATIINRLAKAYGVTPIFLGNCDDRYEVADFCLDVTAQVFQNRKL